MEIIRYELKYCERCGTLKLRRVASESTYCRRCEGLLTRFEFPSGTDGTNSSEQVSPLVRIEGRMASSLRRKGTLRQAQGRLFDSGDAKRALPALGMTGTVELSRLPGRVQ